MSSHDERVDAAIRLLLSRRARPALTPGFSSGLLRRVREREMERERRPRVGARLLLGSYWLAAVLASLWIASRLPWPEWIAPLAWGMALVGAPLAYAIALFPERARAGLAAVAVGLRPLLPPLER